MRNLFKVKYTRYYCLVEPTKIYYQVKFYRNLESSFQVIGNFLIKNVKMEIAPRSGWNITNNLTTFRVHHSTHFYKWYRLLISSFQFECGQTDTPTARRRRKQYLLRKHSCMALTWLISVKSQVFSTVYFNVFSLLVKLITRCVIT